jgi:lysyl endopeptidase
MPRARRLLAAVLLILLALAAPARAVIRIGELVETAIESPHPYPDGTDARPAVWTATLHHPGATFLKVHFARFAVAGVPAAPAPLGDYVSLRDGHGVERAVLTGLDDGDRWAPSIAGDTVEILLHADAHETAFGFEIDLYGYGTVPLSGPVPAGAAGDGAEDEGRSICGPTDDKRPLCDALEPARVRGADPVARLLVVSDCGALLSCTGFLVDGYGDLMTNAHCVNSEREARSLEAWFNYTDDATAAGPCSLPGRPNPDVFQDAELLAADCARDVAILRLGRRHNDNPAETYGFLDLAARAPVAGEPVWIPQHPRGRPKEVVETAATITAAALPGTDFCRDPPEPCLGPGAPTGLISDAGHTGDTENGSSGSPLLDAAGRVIALHHASGCAQAPGANSAVRIDVIAPLLATIPTLDVRRLVATARTPGTLRLEAAFSLAAGRAVDPGAVTLRLAAGGAGEAVLDEGLPAGSLRANARRTRWRYRVGERRTAEGIVRARLGSPDGRRFKLVVVARTHGATPAGPAIDVALELGEERFASRDLRCRRLPGRTICDRR